MRRFLIMITVMSICLCCLAQGDLIIMRNGTEYNGQIALVKQDKTVFKDDKGSQMELPNTDIYMIKYEKRGNVFFTESGERLSSEGDGKIPGGASAIYLVEGKEVIGYDITIDANNITYYPPSKKKYGFIQISKKGSSSLSVPKNEVFLIKYEDGTKDLVTDFETLKKWKETELKRKQAEDEATKKELWLKSFPKQATIITKKEIVINANVLSDDGRIIEFKRTSMNNSPIFVMNRDDIQDVFYKGQ